MKGQLERPKGWFKPCRSPAPTAQGSSEREHNSGPDQPKLSVRLSLAMYCFALPKIRGRRDTFARRLRHGCRGDFEGSGFLAY